MNDPYLENQQDFQESPPASENQKTKLTLSKVGEQEDTGSKILAYIQTSLLIETLLHTLYLTRKNFLLSIRRWKATLAVTFIIPVGLSITVFILRLIVRRPGVLETYVYPTRMTVLDNSKMSCTAFWTSSCFIVAYTTNGNAFSQQVINEVVTYNGYEASSFKQFDNQTAMTTFLSNNPNSTVVGISFDAASNASNINYSLFYNGTGDHTNFMPLFKDLIDSSIYYKGSEFFGKTVSRKAITTHFRGNPVTPDPVREPFDVYVQNGARFYAIPSMVLFLRCLLMIVDEKERNLRLGMEMMGMRKWAYWLSWFNTFTVYSFLLSLFVTLSSLATVAHPFVRSYFLTFFLLFFTYSITLIFMSFLVSSFVSTSKTALVIGFLVLAVSDIINASVTQGDFIYAIFDDATFDKLLMFYPPFNFAKVFMDITLTTRLKYDDIARAYVHNDRWDPSKIFRKYDQFSYTGVQASIWSFLCLFMNIILMTIAAIYLDNILFYKRNLFYFLFPSYWGINFAERKMDSAAYKKSEKEIESMDEDLRNEYYNARDPTNNCAIRLVGLNKVYKRFFGLPIIGNYAKVVKDIDLTVKLGECMAIIGENGAGKTTTLSILNGMIRKSGGNAYVYNKSVSNHMGSVRRALGVCPQHDILWDELTARQHLQLFAEFKGIPRSELKAEIQRRLEQVQLEKVGHHQVRTYSGGMKRRLSVAISFIGAPKIVLLDEPTTGMDPHSRRKVWELIHDKKAKHVIVLTTHSMEEADALANKICIMAYGKVCCVGDSLHLKNKYGAGYNLSLIAETNREEECENLVYEHLPNVPRIHAAGGTYSFNVPLDRLAELIKFLKIVEKLTSEEGSCIKDWGISQTTLDEVYLKVTKAATEEHLKEIGEWKEPTVNPNENQDSITKIEKINSTEGSKKDLIGEQKQEELSNLVEEAEDAKEELSGEGAESTKVEDAEKDTTIEDAEKDTTIEDAEKDTTIEDAEKDTTIEDAEKDTTIEDAEKDATIENASNIQLDKNGSEIGNENVSLEVNPVENVLQEGDNELDGEKDGANQL